MDTSNLSQQFKSQLWILWIALVIGPILFLGIAVKVGPFSPDSSLPEFLPLILSGIGGLIILKSFLLPLFLGRSLARQAIQSAQDPQSRLGAALSGVRTLSIVTWAIAEGGMMLAATAVMLDGWSSAAGAVAAIFVVAMAFSAPTTERVARQIAALLEGADRPASEVETLLGQWR